MSKFEESNFYKTLQDFFINSNKETFLQFLAEFYNRTESIIDKNNIQDDLIKELRELYLELNEKGIDDNIIREKVEYFLENNEKIGNISSQLNTNKQLLDGKTKLSSKKFISDGKPHLTFLFDDCRKSIYTNAFPVFKEKGVKGSLAFIVDYYRKSNSLAMNPNQLSELYNEGWEILSHGVRSIKITSGISENVAINEIVNSKKEIERLGFKVNGFVAPEGSLDVNRMNYVKNNYSFGFCNYVYGDVDFSKDIYNINRYDMSKKTVTQLKTIIDNAIANNKWIVFFDHDIGIDGYTSKESLAEIIEYAIAQGIDIDTPSGIIDKVATTLIKGKALNDKSKPIDYTRNLLKNCNFYGKNNALANFWELGKTLKSGGACTFETRNRKPWSELIFKCSNIGREDKISITQMINYKPTVSTTASLKIPLYANGNNRTVKIEIRAYTDKNTYKESIFTDTIQPQIVYNIYEKDFSIPYYTDVNFLEFRITLLSQTDNNTFNLFLGSPCLEINNCCGDNKEYFNSYLSTIQSTSNTSNSEDIITFNSHSVASSPSINNGVFTVQEDGVYFINCNICVSSDSAINDDFNLQLCQNNTVVRQCKQYVNIPNNKYQSLLFSSIVNLNADDQVSMKLNKKLARSYNIDRASYFTILKVV